MPFDDELLAYFQSNLSLIESEIKLNKIHDIITIGDFNANMKKKNRFDAILKIKSNYKKV